MLVLKTLSEIGLALEKVESPLGLVPTMGAIHGGHIALLKKARSENATLETTIFVNSTQFSSQEDFASYPRSLEQDLIILEAEGTDLVFIPSDEEMYPEGYETRVDVGRIGQVLEGQFREGHFLGVATVVLKLLNICHPDRVYLGQKDGQQCLVLLRMMEDLNLGTELITVPTVRDSNGLALSSRNALLTDEESHAAQVISRALFSTKEMWESGVKNADKLRQHARRILTEEPLVKKVDYISMVSCETLQELSIVQGKTMLSAAVKIGSIRLIDNLILEPVRDDLGKDIGKRES